MSTDKWRLGDYNKSAHGTQRKEIRQIEQTAYDWRKEKERLEEEYSAERSKWELKRRAFDEN